LPLVWKASEGVYTGISLGFSQNRRTVIQAWITWRTTITCLD